jgi:PAS domain S-box-containing protein
VAGASEIAAWLIARRLQIEQVMASRLGPAAPAPGATETEVLRRFRSYAAFSLRRGTAGEPALDGLRVNERRVSALLAAWCEAAADAAGPHSESVREALHPVMLSFRNALRTTNSGRRKRGAARAGRRAVMAAIDRISDVFLAIDADSGRIVDANPAAGALLGVARDALIDVEAASFIPAESRSGWWTQFDAVTEGTEPRRFTASLADKGGTPIPVDCTVTAFATRDRTLALVVARPA